MRTTPPRGGSQRTRPASPPALPAEPYEIEPLDFEDRPGRFFDRWPDETWTVVSTAVDPESWPAWTDSARFAPGAGETSAETTTTKGGRHGRPR